MVIYAKNLNAMLYRVFHHKLYFFYRVVDSNMQVLNMFYYSYMVTSAKNLNAMLYRVFHHKMYFFYRVLNLFYYSYYLNEVLNLKLWKL